MGLQHPTPIRSYKNVDNTFIIGYYHEEWHLIKLTRSIYPILGTDYNSSLDWGTDSIHTILHLILSIILSSQPNSPLHQHKVIRFITELSEVRALEREFEQAWRLEIYWCKCKYQISILKNINRVLLHKSERG